MIMIMIMIMIIILKIIQQKQDIKCNENSEKI